MRRHYGTTGDRLHLHVEARFDCSARRYLVDPLLDPRGAKRGGVGCRHGRHRGARRYPRPHPCPHRSGRPDRAGRLALRRTHTRNPAPYDVGSLGSRIRVVWEGAEYRGRGRMTTWDGRLEVSRQPHRRVCADQFLASREDARCGRRRGAAMGVGHDRQFRGRRHHARGGGAPAASTSTRHTSRPRSRSATSASRTRIFDAGGLERRVRVFRLPERNVAQSYSFERDNRAQCRPATRPSTCASRSRTAIRPGRVPSTCFRKPESVPSRRPRAAIHRHSFLEIP